MKKYKITLYVDEFHIADSLHKIAGEVENNPETAQKALESVMTGDHYEIESVIEFEV